jgi:hypothetical protein
VVLMEQLRAVYRKQEQKLDDAADTERARTAAPVCRESPDPGGTMWSIVSHTDLVGRRPAASEETMLSKTDLDTAVVRKGRGDGARPRYKNHRVVDDRFGVITAIETTAGDIAENTKLFDLVQQHESHTGLSVETVVADTQYGTNDNFAECQKRGIRSHMGDLKQTYKNDQSKAVFGEEKFHYDAAQDVYVCPAGETLKRQREDRGFHVYGIGAKICRNCCLRIQCTRSKTGRTLKRHPDYERIQVARQQSHSGIARQDRRRRRYLMEGSFADATNNHGLKRARWRGLRNQQTQDYLIATCQNIRALIRLGRVNPPVRSMRMKPPTVVRESIWAIARASAQANRFDPSEQVAGVRLLIYAENTVTGWDHCF